jgi:hypothetical protein
VSRWSDVNENGQRLVFSFGKDVDENKESQTQKDKQKDETEAFISEFSDAKIDTTRPQLTWTGHVPGILYLTVVLTFDTASVVVGRFRLV